MSDSEVPQVSLALQFHGDPPLLHSIQFKSAVFTDKVEDLQNRRGAKAVATILLLFRAQTDLQLFRIRTELQNGGIIRTILNAKKQPPGKSCIRDLANGFFLKLFLKPTTSEGRYLDLDVYRLRPSSVEVTHDCRPVDDPVVLSNLAAKIAGTAGWNLNEHPLEIIPKEQNRLSNPEHASATPIATRLENDVRQPQLDNPAVGAIRDAIRLFCEDGTHEHLRVRHVRSCGELEDLWAIDNEAYGEASITYEKFKDWWRHFPAGLHALFFHNRVMGAIGIWPLSPRCAGLMMAGRLKESELTGRIMRTIADAQSRFWYVSGIVLRPELIGGRAIKILLSNGIGSWLTSTHIQFPCELLALAYSDQGQALLEGFNFYKVQNAKAMPDHAPLFGLKVMDKDDLTASLKARGLEVAF